MKIFLSSLNFFNCTVFLSIYAACFMLVPSFGQQLVRGEIFDATTLTPLAGANIQAIGKEEGTFTDEKGRFELSTDARKLRISFTGYQPQEVQIKADNPFLDIKLDQADGKVLEMILVQASPIQRQVPAPLQKIVAAQLERDAGLSIQPALNRVSGVYMHSGAFNTNRITIRGIGNRSAFGTAKIRAYFNDIPLTSGVGETTIEDIDLSMLDEVEVWKGPTASVYGAGLGGMIHLKAGNPKKTSSIASGIQLGSFGLFRNVSELRYYSPDEKVELHLNGNITQSDGYRENNDYDRKSFTALGQIKASEKNELSFLVNYIDLKAFIPSSINRNDFANNPEVAAANWAAIMGFEDYQKVLAGLSNRHVFYKKQNGNSLSNTTSLFTTTRTAYEPRPFNILRENSNAFGFRSRLDWNAYQYQAASSRKWYKPHLSLGIEYFRESYDWQTYEINDGKRGDILSDNQEVRIYYNLFSEAQFKFGQKAFASLGLNFNQTKYDLADFFLSNGDISGAYRFEGIWSPRLGVGYNVSDEITLFGVVSHGFSAPTLEETLAPEGTINPSIQPERGWNFELGSRGELWNRLGFDVSVFSMQIQDLLVARRTAEDQFVGVNAGKTAHNGAEVFLNYQWKAANWDWQIFTSYTYADYSFQEFEDGDADYSGNALTGTAPNTLQAGVDFRWNKGFYGNLNYQFIDKMPIRDDNSFYADAFQVMNLKLGYEQTIAKKIKLDLHFGVNNIADEHYASMILINAGSFGGAAPRYYYPGMPRHYYGGIRLEYLLGVTRKE